MKPSDLLTYLFARLAGTQAVPEPAPLGPPVKIGVETTFGVRKLAVVVPVATELLHPRELTPEEIAKHDEERRDLWRRTRRATRQLADLGGIERTILDLHTLDADGECDGCDYAGAEGEAPYWPCRTVRAIAQRHEIDLSDSPAVYA